MRSEDTAINIGSGTVSNMPPGGSNSPMGKLSVEGSVTPSAKVTGDNGLPAAKERSNKPSSAS